MTSWEETRKLANFMVDNLIESYDYLPEDEEELLSMVIEEEYEQNGEWWCRYAESTGILAIWDEIPEHIMNVVGMYFVEKYDMMEDYLRESRFA